MTVTGFLPGFRIVITLFLETRQLNETMKPLLLSVILRLLLNHLGSINAFAAFEF